jgi:hypothetical protein
MADPTIPGYLDFLRRYVGIPPEALADDDPDIEASYWASLTIVNYWLVFVGTADPSGAQNTYYTWAVYNLGAHILISTHLDDPNAPEPWNHYWSDLRAKYGLDSFVLGVIQSSADQGTSQSLLVPDWVKNLTMFDLALLKTPWGRRYLGLAQAYGPTIWGLT